MTKTNSHWRINYQFVIQTRFTITYWILYHLANPREIKKKKLNQLSTRKLTAYDIWLHCNRKWDEFFFDSLIFIHKILRRKVNSHFSIAAASIPKRSCDADWLLIQFNKTRHSVFFLYWLKETQQTYELSLFWVNKTMKGKKWAKISHPRKSNEKPNKQKLCWIPFYAQTHNFLRRKTKWYS